MTSPARTPAGVRTGGQFAGSQHGESAEALVPGSPSAFDVETLVALSRGWRAESQDENGVVLTRGHDERVRVEIDEDYGTVSCYDLSDDDPDSMPVAEAHVDQAGFEDDRKRHATEAAARMLADLEWGDPGEKLQAEFSQANVEFSRAEQRRQLTAARLVAHNVTTAYPEAVAVEIHYGAGDSTEIVRVNLVDAAGGVIGEDDGENVPAAEHWDSITTPLRSLNFFDDEWRRRTGATSGAAEDPYDDDWNITRVPVAGLAAVEG